MEAEGTLLLSTHLGPVPLSTLEWISMYCISSPGETPKPGSASDATGPSHWLQSEQVPISVDFCIFFECYSFPAKRHKQFPLVLPSSPWDPQHSLFSLSNPMPLTALDLLRLLLTPLL